MSNLQIIATLGPASLNSDFLTWSRQAGIDLLRINMSHTRIEDLEKTIQLIQWFTTTPICIDSEGAQLRCGKVKEGTVLREEEYIKIHHNDTLGDRRNLSFYPPKITEQFQIGDVINIDFDSAQIVVFDKQDDGFGAIVTGPGAIGSNKACDSSRKLNLPAITFKDKEAFIIAKKYEITNYALSFANRTQDIADIRSLFEHNINLISKIETREGLRNLDSILKETDEILIDRGDLSRQVTIEAIPFLQKLIIERAKFFNKPVLVATNLLESMINNRMPTRAEANDIVSTLAMGADGLVLAAETAIGKHPKAAISLVKTLLKYYNMWKTGTSIEDILSFLERK